MMKKCPDFMLSVMTVIYHVKIYRNSIRSFTITKHNIFLVSPLGARVHWHYGLSQYTSNGNVSHSPSSSRWDTLMAVSLHQFPVAKNFNLTIKSNNSFISVKTSCKQNKIFIYFHPHYISFIIIIVDLKNNKSCIFFYYMNKKSIILVSK